MNKEEIKEMYSMRDIVSRYGMHINRSGFCSCPFHTGDRTPSLKVYDKDFHCHACGANGDIFTWVMLMDNLSFKEAYESLGGTSDMPITARIKADQARAKRKHQEYLRSKAKLAHKKNIMYISAYQNILTEFEPFSDVWCYAYNKLQYQLYLLERWGDND